MKASDEANLQNLSTKCQGAQADMFSRLQKNAQGKIDANDEQIKQLEQERQTLINKAQGDDTAAINSIGKDVGIPDPDPNAPPAPAPTTTPAPTVAPRTEADYWVPITVEISSEASHESKDTSATSYSAGVSASFGAFHVNASMSHSDSASTAASQMASSSVNVSFECMRVDIARSWLRAELFYDDDLKPGHNVE